MLPLCDVLSLHAPGTPETKHMMNRETFALLKQGAIFVNVARGSLVDESALSEALEAGRLFGAGLDVFEREPEFNRRLFDFPNVFLTPNMGSATLETRNAMGELAAENIQAVFEGRAPLTPITP